MDSTTTANACHAPGRFALPGAALEIVSDSTLCLTPHAIARRCRACGTVYRGSVVEPLTTDRPCCPYCGSPRTGPVREAGGHPAAHGPAARPLLPPGRPFPKTHRETQA